jgi:cell division transport system ATP-binding protein
MIKFNHVVKVFEKGWTILDDLNFSVSKGEFVFLIGPTGAGKTTIFKHIYMEEFPTRGQVVVGEYNSSNIKKGEIPYLRRKIGIVFQDFKLFTERNVFENIAFALQVTGFRKSYIRKRVYNVLAEMGLSHRIYEKPLHLSGGEQQKVCIARALAGGPEIILADEPTGNLDDQAAAEIMGILKEINIGGATIIMATHNQELVEKSHFRKIVIEKGRLAGKE